MHRAAGVAEGLAGSLREILGGRILRGLPSPPIRAISPYPASCPPGIPPAARRVPFRTSGSLVDRGLRPLARTRRPAGERPPPGPGQGQAAGQGDRLHGCCLLYTSDAADEEDSVDLGGRRVIKKK